MDKATSSSSRPPKDSKAAPALASEEYYVKLNTQGGYRLGLAIRPEPDGTLLVVQVGSGLAHLWGIDNPHYEIKEGHVVLEVNGIRGDTAKMMEEMSNPTRVELTLMRRELTPVSALLSDEWDSSNLTQRMRMLEIRDRELILFRTNEAIKAISRSREPHDFTVWEAAGAWSLTKIYSGQEAPYLGAYGFEVEDKAKWRTPPPLAGPRFEVKLDKHEKEGGHTWYLVSCALIPPTGTSLERVDWPAPRRLVQLRLDLHDRVKEWLGPEYPKLFGTSPFAKYGGPPGTTARLVAWLANLCKAINSGAVTPAIATLTLAFFQAPPPPNMPRPPDPVATAVRFQDGDDAAAGGDADAESPAAAGWQELREDPEDA